MADKTIRITGLRETVAKLKLLPKSISEGKGNPIRGALFVAAKLFKQQAISNAPVGVGTPFPGLLKRSIIMHRSRSPRSEGVAEKYRVMVRSSRRKGRGAIFGARTAGAFYWHFVEFGTSGPGRGQPPQYYLTRAFYEMAQRSVQVFTEEFRKGLDQVISKIGAA